MSAGGKETAEDYCAEGTRLSTGPEPDYKEAIRCFRLAIEKNPNLIKAWSRLGKCYFDSKEYDNAVKVYTEILSRFKKNLSEDQKAKGSSYIALSHRYNENYDKGVEWYEKALVLDKNNSEILNNYAYLLARTGKLQEAEEKLKKAIQIESHDPDSPLLMNIHDTKGFILLNKGQYKAAEEEFLEVIRIFEAYKGEKNRQKNKTYATALASRGVALLFLRQFSDAIECFNKSLDIDKKQNNNLLADTTRAHILTNIGQAFGFLANGEAERQQKISKAQKIYNKIINATDKAEVEKMSANNGLGVCYGNQEKFEEAVECFDRVIQANARKQSTVTTTREYLTGKDITLAYAYRNKGVALINLGKNAKYKKLKEKYDTKENYEKAVDCFRKSLNIYPKLATAWNGKGVVKLILTDYGRALDYFKRAKDITELTNAHYNEGRAYDQKKDFDKAIECFNNAIRIDPKFAQAYVSKGFSLGKKAEGKSTIGEQKIALYIESIACFDEAFEYYKKVNSSDVGYSDAYRFKGYALLNVLKDNNSRRYDEVMECFNLAEKQSPSAYTHNSKGYVLHYFGKYYEAIRCFNKAIEKDENFIAAFANKGHSLNSLGRYYEAMECFDMVTNFFEKQRSLGFESVRKVILSHALNGKGVALYALGQEEEAIRCFEEAEKCGEYITTSKLNKARYEYERGRILEALDYFGEIDDDSNVVLKSQKLNNVGLCYFSLGMYEEAEKEYLEAIRANPKLAEPYFNLGVLYNKDNKPDKAKRMFEVCIKADYKSTKAKEALEKLEYAARKTTDWYEWWFVSSSAYKKALGITIIAFIFMLFSIILYLSFTSLNLGSIALNLSLLEEILMIDTLQGNSNTSTESSPPSSSTEQNTGVDQTDTLDQAATNAASNTISSVIVILIVLMGIFMILLFLPSLRTIKVGSVELTTVSESIVVNTNEIKQEPSLSQQTPPTLYFQTTAISEIKDDVLMDIEQIRY